MNKKTIIMMGNSGCGKGTQATILENYFKNKNEEVFHLELGSQFRDLLNSTTYTATVAKKIAKKGGLQPEFLAIKLWAKMFNKYYSPEKNLIIDGTPRRLTEAIVLEETLKFYEIERPIVIFLNTSREVATERMLGRKRADDTLEKIKERLDWFEKDVMPTIEYFRKNKDFDFIEIDGSQGIEEISKEIREKLNLD